jgi:hypothetical protein
VNNFPPLLQGHRKKVTSILIKNYLEFERCSSVPDFFEESFICVTHLYILFIYSLSLIKEGTKELDSVTPWYERILLILFHVKNQGHRRDILREIGTINLNVLADMQNAISNRTIIFLLSY